LAHDASGLSRQPAVNDLAVRDADKRFEPLLDGVKMGRRALVMIHADDYAEKDRNDRHLPAFQSRRVHPAA